MTQAHRILVTQPIHAEVHARLARLGEVDVYPGPGALTRDELTQRLRHATALMGFMTDRVDDALLAEAPHLRVVSAALKGYDSYDAAACARRGIHFASVPDLLTAPTAELGIGLAIALGRHVLAGDAQVREGRFAGWRPQFYGRGLAGSQVAVIGLGNLGRALCERLRPFGCQLMGVDPVAPPPSSVVRVGLDAALASADFVLIAAPLTPDTIGLIGATQIAASRPGTLWVNVGRGSVVDEAAMLAGLESGHVGGYAADVFAFEDWSLADRPCEIAPALRQHPRTVFTPHLGSAVREVRLAIEHAAAEAIERVLT